MSNTATVQRMSRTGTVLAVNGPTARIQIVETRVHPIYKKRYTLHKNLAADIPKSIAVAVGQKVRVEACRRISKSKVWRVTNIV